MFERNYVAGMKKIVFIIEMAKDGGFSCYTNEKFDGFALYGYGDSVSETKEDLLELYEEIKEINKEQGIETPELEFEFRYDIASFFEYFKMLNMSEVARMSGINESQMRRYKTRKINASQKTYDKLYNCVQNIGRELLDVKF